MQDDAVYQILFSKIVATEEFLKIERKKIVSWLFTISLQFDFSIVWPEQGQEEGGW